ELVEDAAEAARFALVLVLFVVCVVADARGERDARRVRAPLDRLDALLQVGELAGLAADGGDRVEGGRRLVVAAARREREPLAVGRPARRAVAALAGGELHRFVGAVERRDPDSAPVLARLLVDPRHDVRDTRAVGRDARIARVHELVDVPRLHAAHRAGL